MEDLIWLTIALPLAGAVFLLVAGRRLGEPRAGVVGTLTVAGAFGVAVPASLDFFSGDGEAMTVRLFDWIPGLGLEAELLWDPLAAVMTLVVTGVGTLIHLYSIGYMQGDERYGRFFSYLNLFVVSMLILVLGANFGLLFVGWELVGLSSYLLISFWFTRPEAAAAGKKAFIVNRIGDVAFMIALLVIFASFGTFGYDAVFERSGVVLTTTTATLVALLLFIGAAGKSAQFPLHVWLPDAMEGPTPVSALIHAATMVTAGVYMVARTAPLFELAPVAAGVVATVGILTALGAALVAVAQFDIKRVLAYSTISQLGYMFLGVGSGAYTAGIFHLYTHAFFKALLFLGAGAVIHALADEQDMRQMGGLRRAMPATFATMGIAVLAISGIPPLSGFFSKDEILAAAFERGGGWVALWAVGILTAVVTALYMGRLLYLTFFGERRSQSDAHEAPLVMAVPLVVLGVGSVVAGLVNTPWRLGLEHFLEPSFEGVALAGAPEPGTQWVLGVISVAAGVLGLAYATRRYLRAEAPDEAGGRWDFVRSGYRLDDAYGAALVLPGKAAAGWTDTTADQDVIDGAVNGVGRLVRDFGSRLRPVQTGFVRSYGSAVMIGSVALLGWFILRGGF